MAEKKQTESAAAESAAPKFSVERLRRDCYTLFHTTTSTFDGAASGLSTDAAYTVEEMRSIIQDWLKTPVRTAKEG